MSQTKAQLIQPIGVVTASGVVVTGVVTASSFDGDVVGSATSIISGANLNVGIISATNFSGDFTGTATGIKTGADIKVGSFTATNFTGDFTGTATSMMRGTGFEAGAINATGFNVSGTTTGNVTGDVTGNIAGNVTGNVTGNVIAGTAGSVASGSNIHVGVMTATSYVGDGQNLTGIAATNFNTQTVPGSTYSINVTASGSSAYTLSGTDRNGSVSGSNASVSVEIGDTLNFVVDASGHPFYIRVSDGGANVSTPAATNQGAVSGTVSWTPNTAGTYYYQCGNHAAMIGTITVTATTTIDLSAGNVITFNQDFNTTISFANTSTSMDVTLIRDKDDTDTARTITWPDSVYWNGGSAPTLVNNQRTTTRQQFQFLTRDSGVTWYGWETMKNDPADSLWAVGSNNIGQLGQNSPAPSKRSSPIQIGTTAKWRHIAADVGTDTGCQAGLKNDGTLWMWGKNSRGGLGLNEYGGSGNDYSRSSPTQVGTDTDWAFVDIKDQGAYGVKTDGTLWVWGNNQYGILGDNEQGSGNSRSSPTQLPGTTWSTDPKSMSGGYFMMAIKTDGTLWAWGYGSNGRLGLNGPHSGSSRSSPTQVGTDTTWDSIDTGGATNFATKTDGTFWAWGAASGDGDLGLNDKTNRSSPTQLPGSSWSTGYQKRTAHSQGGASIKTDGTLWTWGNNGQGELGLGNKTEYSSPKQVGTDTTWRTVQGGNDSMYATKTDGTLWSWGTNTNGTLGHNNTTGYSSPKQVGTATIWGEKLGYLGFALFGMQLPS